MKKIILLCSLLGISVSNAMLKTVASVVARPSALQTQHAQRHQNHTSAKLVVLREEHIRQACESLKAAQKIDTALELSAPIAQFRIELTDAMSSRIHQVGHYDIRSRRNYEALLGGMLYCFDAQRRQGICSESCSSYGFDESASLAFVHVDVEYVMTLIKRCPKCASTMNNKTFFPGFAD